jgi:hypothetical protein
MVNAASAAQGLLQKQSAKNSSVLLLSHVALVPPVALQKKKPHDRIGRSWGDELLVKLRRNEASPLVLAKPVVLSLIPFHGASCQLSG